MKKNKSGDPLLFPMYPASKRAAELKLLAELDNPDSELRKKLVAEGRYKILNPQEYSRKEVLFNESDDRLEEIGFGDGNFRMMKSDEIPAAPAAEVVSPEE